MNLDHHNCPTCGSPRPPHAPEGLCPGCLIRAGFDSSAPSLSPNGKTVPTLDLTGARVLETLAASVGPVPRVLLRDTDAAAEPPVIRPATHAADPTLRYRIDGEIARGGMGAVLRGRDPDLGRDVALKVLRDDFRNHPEMVQRFVEEAQIGGQLQHPGIVPVYELGTFADARPYFSMKLVKGQTLADLLATRSDPADGLPRLLGIFEPLAQTVAYAHARGVIHRDLKPSNIMVGSFGEVQVMDWGLAKVLPRGGVADDQRAGRVEDQETVISTARSGSDSDIDLSRAGSVMGTPSYMAPEQARGEVHRIDERADVFALGSILCEILTGGPAFVGRNSGEIQRRAARGDTAPALTRLDACAADPELVALARDCLAAEPDDRPRDAGAVSERFSAYLIGVREKLRRTELARVEERARRRLTTLAAAVAVLLMAGIGGGLWWTTARRAERVARTTRAVDEALAEASSLAGQAGADPAKWDATLNAAKRARGLLAQGEADPALRRRVTDRLAELTAHRQRVVTDRRLLDALEAARGVAADSQDWSQADSAYAAAFRAAGLDLDTTDPKAAGAWIKKRTDPAEMTVYLDDWAFVRRAARRPQPDWRRLVAAARAADPDPWRDALRAKVGARDETSADAFRALADDARALDAQPAASLVLLALQLRNGIGDHQRAEAVLRRAWQRFPDDFWVNHWLALAPGKDQGTLHDVFPRPAQALRYLTAAVAVRPDSVLAHINLGIALQVSGDRSGAIAAYGEAVRLKPDFAWAHFKLGYALQLSGDLPGAIAAGRKAVQLDPGYAWTHYRLGNALRESGDLTGALAQYREAVRLDPGHASAHSSLVTALHDSGDLAGAVAAFGQAIDLLPEEWEHYQPRSRLMADIVDDDELFEALALARPDDALLRVCRGRYLAIRGRWDAAADLYAAAIGDGPPSEVWYEHAALRLLVGDEAGYRAVIRQMADDWGEDPGPWLDYVRARTAALVPDPGIDAARVVSWAQRAVSAQRSHWWDTHTLGLALLRAGKPKEAIDRFETALASGGNRQNGSEAMNRLGLAMAHHQLGHDSEARRQLDRVLAWTEQTAQAVRAGNASPPMPGWLQIAVLRREAEPMIPHPTPAPTPDPHPESP